MSSNTYIIPKSDHNDLYIFEGYLHDFFIDNDLLEVIIRHVEYPVLPNNFAKPDYFDIVKIKFYGLSYMNLELSLSKKGRLDSRVKFGEIKDGDELLDYGGAWGYFGDSNYLTFFTLELVCQSIELFFLDQEENKKLYKKL